jgi:hypothetical protein
MLTRLICRLNRNKTRLTWPGLALMMLLQRTPIPWLVAEFQFSVGPRMVHLLKWVTGAAVTSAFYNTVTGATGDLSSVGNTTALEGSYMVVAIQADDALPVTAKIEGELPSGLNHNLGEGGAVSEFGVITISGIATTTGVYPVIVTVLTWQTLEEPTEQPERSIQINFQITLQPPDIVEPPASVVIPFGATAELFVVAADPEGSTYQWQRNVEDRLDDFEDIVGAVDAVYSVPGATPALNGAYRVLVSKNDITITSNYAFMTVEPATNFDVWQNKEFAQPNSEEAQPLANPDGDSFSNAFEFLFDLDPLEAETLQVPMITREQIGETDYVVFTFPSLITFSGLNYGFESTSDLKNGPWTELVDGVDGVIIDASVTATILKMPYVSEAYCRVRMDTDG